MNKIEMDTNRVRPGERITYKLYYDKREPFHGDVIKQLIGIGQSKSVWSVLDRTGGNLPCGKNMVVQSGTVIPLTLPPGEYFLRVSIRYQVNPLRFSVEEYDTPSFKVSGKPRIKSYE